MPILLEPPRDLLRKPYVLALGPATDPLLIEAFHLLKSKHPALETLCVPDPLLVQMSVYTGWQHGWSVIEGANLGPPRRLDDALAVLALRILSDAPNDDRFDTADNRYRYGETYAAWLALLSDPAVRVLNRPGSRWPPLDAISRFDIRAIARIHGVTTLHEVIGARAPADASWRLHLVDGSLRRLDMDAPALGHGPPHSHINVDVPWERVIVSQVAGDLKLDAPTRRVPPLDSQRLMTDAHQLFAVFGVDVGHAIFVRERGRFVFSSLSLTTPVSCSRAHIRHIATTLVTKCVLGPMSLRCAEAEP